MFLHTWVHWSQWRSNLVEASKILCEGFSGSGPIWIHHVMKVAKDRRRGKEKIRWPDPAVTFEMAKRQHEAFPILYSLPLVFKTVKWDCSVWCWYCDNWFPKRLWLLGKWFGQRNTNSWRTCFEKAPVLEGAAHTQRKETGWCCLGRSWVRAGIANEVWSWSLDARKASSHSRDAV